jgi:hypothetical protein
MGLYPLDRLGCIVVGVNRPNSVAYDRAAVQVIIERVSVLLASDEELAALLSETYSLDKVWFSTSVLNPGKDAPQAS